MRITRVRWSGCASRWNRAPGGSFQPDAYAIATAIHAEKRGHEEVRLESFDKRVAKAYGDSFDTSPEAVIARSHTLSVADAARAFTSPNEWAVSNWEDVVDQHLRLTEHFYGPVPTPAVAADVPAGNELELERRLLAWEESVTPTHPPATSESFGWYEPRPHGPVGLVLLPVSEPCDAAAYLSFFGAEGDGKHDALARLMRDWQGRFGAHLVASWGTMLQFVVRSPPETLGEAFDLAALHAQIAPCTVVLPGVGVRQLARHLWRGERWFLHERP